MIYSCSLEFDRALTAEQQATALREAGFTHCFLTWGLAGEGIGKVAAAHKAGLTVETIHASYPGCNEMWLEGEVGEARLQYFLDCVRGTAMIGAKTMILHVSSGHQPPEMCELAITRFQKICDEGERLGVNIAFENLTNILYLHYVMERVHSPAKKYCFDCGHENLYYKNDGVLERYAPLLVAIHLHDNAGDHDTHLLPFTASIDFDRVAKRLAAVPFPPDPYAIRYASDPRAVQNAPDPCTIQPAPDPYAIQNAPDLRTVQNSPDPCAIQNAPDLRTIQPALDPCAIQNAPDPCAIQNAPDIRTIQPAPDPCAIRTPRQPLDPLSCTPAGTAPCSPADISPYAAPCSPADISPYAAPISPADTAPCSPADILPYATPCSPAGDEFPIPITLELKANGSDPDLARRAYAAATRIGELVEKYRKEFAHPANA